MTLLSMVQDILGEAALPSISSVVGTGDVRSRPLFALAKRALERVSNDYDWRTLIEVGTFNTVVGQAEYDLPDDYGKFMPDTLWDSTKDYRMIGGATPDRWQWVNINGGMPCGARFMVRGWSDGYKVRITPTPDTVYTVAFMYKSNALAVAENGDTKATYTADSDTSKLPENIIALDLKWRYIRQRGLDYAEEFREAKEAAEKAFAESLVSPTIELAAMHNKDMLWPLSEGYVPDTGYGA